MKTFSAIFMLAILAACETNTAETSAIENNYIVSETLAPYALSDSLTVYSAQAQIFSPSTATLCYVAEIVHNGKTFRDSLILDIDSNQTVKSQIIFSDCEVDEGAKPKLESSIVVIVENK